MSRNTKNMNCTSHCNVGSPWPVMIFMAFFALPIMPADVSVQLTDIDGKVHTITGETPSATKASVLVFINTDCPIANSYQPYLQRLREEFDPKEFAIILVHGNPKLRVDETRQHQKDFNISLPVVLDPDQAIARRYHATITPQAVVVDSKGEMLYTGRIDDRNSAYGRRRQTASREDLRLVLQSISANKPVDVPETTAIGCRIVFEE